MLLITLERPLFFPYYLPKLFTGTVRSTICMKIWYLFPSEIDRYYHMVDRMLNFATPRAFLATLQELEGHTSFTYTFTYNFYLK